MREIFGKTIGSALAFTIPMLGLFNQFKCEYNFILTSIIIFISSSLILYIWFSYEPLKEKEKLKQEKLILKDSVIELENKVENLEVNKKGLLEERQNFHREIDLQKNKILILESKNRDLRDRIIQNDRRE